MNLTGCEGLERHQMYRVQWRVYVNMTMNPGVHKSREFRSCTNGFQLLKGGLVGWSELLKQDPCALSLVAFC
jgi:hypothetical protein